MGTTIVAEQYELERAATRAGEELDTTARRAKRLAMLDEARELRRLSGRLRAVRDRMVRIGREREGRHPQ